MRVLHLNSLLKGGGTDDRSVRITHALHQLGQEVWLAGPAGQEFSVIAERLGVPFVPLKAGPLRLPLIIRTAKCIRKHRIQIIHARHGRDFWPCIAAARLSLARPKVVLSRHLAKSPSGFSRRFLLGQCDALVAVSHFVAHVLKEGHADPESDNPERHYRPPMRGDLSKIHVVYGGFDMERFHPGEAMDQRRQWNLRPEDYAFAVVGGYAFPRGKGQPEFLKAAAQIAAKVPNARFLIIGRGSMRESLEAQIRSLGLEKVAWLTPYCTDMPAAMNAIDCMVLPQVGTEAIPGVVCEAHACGKPVIASNLDGIPEAFNVARYGDLVTASDIQQLGIAMQKWAGTPALQLPERQQMHEAVAAVFSLERAAQELVSLYEALLQGRTAGVQATFASRTP